jgi:hypothetical protein
MYCPMPKEVLMRILAFAILAIGTVSIGPVAAQTYNPAHPVCLQLYGDKVTTSIAAIRHSPTAARRPRAARQSASSIHILRTRECPRDDIIAASIKLPSQHDSA